MNYDFLFGAIGVIIGATSSFFAFKNFARIKKGDEKRDAAELAEIKGNLIYIKTTVDIIKEDVKDINPLKVQVAALDEALKSVFKRIEHLEIKEIK